MRFAISAIHFHVLPMRTRFPFKYGIASMSALPHLFVTADVEVGGKKIPGIASEGLPPKWFTKDPVTPFETDLAEMLAVIQNAARLARNAAEKSVSFFEFWRSIYDEQDLWARTKSIPPLLANLGVSLMERAVLCGLCWADGRPFHQLLASGAFEIDLGSVRPELQGIAVNRVVSSPPISKVFVRHTVGLGDPLRAADIPENERLRDGLPYGLDESIRAYGLRYFKIKVCGRPEIDVPRLREITAVITENCRSGFVATLDGNEQFESLAAFADFFAGLTGDPALTPLIQNIVFVEQPLHRSHALDATVGEGLRDWKENPGMIIDESDGSLDDLPRALSLGYCGTSHKNCKGIVKGLANAALLRKRKKENQKARCILSGEDLGNVGPVALLQDLAVMAVLGIRHVERNGHHYFRGLSMYPGRVQSAVLQEHGDLYRKEADGFPSLDIDSGHIALRSVNRAPFGFAIPFDPSEFEPLESWIQRGGMGEL